MGVRGRFPVRDYILILIGASIMGFAIKNFYDPIGLVTGGASGVAIILKKQFGVPLWLTNTAINIPLFAAAAKLKGWSFIKRAGTVIVASSIVLWFLQGFGFTESGFGMVEDNNSSLLAAIGSAIAFIFAPLGFGDWQSAVAVFTGLIAKENVVSTFGVLFHVGAEVTEDDANLWAQVALHYTQLTAYS